MAAAQSAQLQSSPNSWIQSVMFPLQKEPYQILNYAKMLCWAAAMEIWTANIISVWFQTDYLLMK